MKIYIDIDETICNTPSCRNYSLAKQIFQNIEKANELYKKGHTIIYWTARGTGSGINWRNETEKQFIKWGVKYHDLKFNKPEYDLFICDKTLNTRDWDNKN